MTEESLPPVPHGAPLQKGLSALSLDGVRRDGSVERREGVVGMREHPNAVAVRKGYDAVARSDIEAIREVLAERVVWHEPGRSVLAGDYKGVDEVLGFLRRLQKLSGGTFRAELVDLLVDAERVTAFQRITGQRGETTLDTVDVVDFEIHCGRVTEVTVYQSDTYAFDQFWE